MVVPIYTMQEQKLKVLDASPPCQHLVLSDRCVCCYLVDLIFISLMTHEIEHFCTCSLAI